MDLLHAPVLVWLLGKVNEMTLTGTNKKNERNSRVGFTRLVFQLVMKKQRSVTSQMDDNLCFGRWSEVMRRLELWIQILEINENGDFVPVEVVPARDVRTGGIFQLRQVGRLSDMTAVHKVGAGEQVANLS